MVKKIRKKIKHKLIAFFSQRNLVLLVVFGMLSAILAGRLFVLQIVNGQYYTDSFTVKTTATRMIKSSRGNIYDATGKLLAYNKLANNVTMEDNGSYDTTREKNLTLNGEIRQLTQMIRKNGDMLAHDFHIIVGTTGRYTFDTDNEVTLARFRADVYGYATIDELKSDEVYASAEKIMKDLCSEDFFQLTDSEEPITDKEKEKYGLPDDYDKQEALDFILKRIRAKDHPELAENLPDLISQTIDADMAYMHEHHVIDEEGDAGTEYYEDDDAFEYMVEKLAEENDLDPVKAVKLASLVDDYMDYQQEYLESKGLVGWDDE